jgi:glycosyltransferase involved in cell wall biosynthesis
LYRLIEERYLSSVDGFICNSRNTYETVKRVAETMKPSLIAHPGGDRLEKSITADELTRRAQRKGPLNILFVGAVIPRKELHNLINALEQVPAEDWSLKVAGMLDMDEVYVRRICRRIEEARLQDRIRLLGTVSDADLEKLMRESHLLVVPSSYEGFGIVYLEGMAFGLPSIASDAGGAKEVITDNVNGFLVPPGDPLRLRDHIVNLVRDRERLLAMSIAALDRFSTHPTWTDTGRAIHRFLHDFVGSRG